MSDKNRNVVADLLVQVWAQNNLDEAEGLIAPSYRSHVPDLAPARMSHWTGAQVVRVEVAAYRSAFPDLDVEVRDLVAEGSTVAATWTMGGNNTGTLKVSPSADVVDEEVGPSGRELIIGAVGVFGLEGGKIAKAAYQWHPMGLLDQVRLFARGVSVLDLNGNKVSVVVPPED